MLILLHVLIALGGIASAGLSAVSPSVFKFRITYGLVGLTFISGTYLVISSHTNLTQACGSGLVYLGLVFVPMAVARKRLAGKSSLD
jgi:hypothetical protein